MAKGEKVKSKSKAKPPPPSDISNSDISDSSIDDESSDEEIDKLTKNLDGKTKLFITKLMEDLESVQAELESRPWLKNKGTMLSQRKKILLSRKSIVT